MCAYVYTCAYIVHIYIYIYVERERHTHTYIYIYTNNSNSHTTNNNNDNDNDNNICIEGTAKRSNSEAAARTVWQAKPSHAITPP